jgi:beta-mannosidase
VEHTQLRWLRTTLLGRTPGWSPPAPAVGPWRDVWLQRRPVDLQDLDLRTTWQAGAGALSLQARLCLAAGVRVAQARLVCQGRGHLWATPLALTAEGGLQADLPVPGVQPWWPHTHGEPALYAAHLELVIEGQTAPLTLSLGELGFRQIELDQHGGGFALRINGEPVFCRGACWTPLDAVSLRASPEALRAAVRQVREAGMNMLRLPGPMVYEEAAFYAACDAEGVMVWQEFMFSNMDYPADDADFAAQVDAEVVQQLQRWQPHACITVLCGNSEQEQQAAMWAAPREIWEPALFHARIPGHCARWLPQVPYWPSSAHGGAFPFRPDVGTTSYYGVGAYLRPVADARASGVRFAAECLAFTNVPPASTLARAIEDDGDHPYQSRFKAAERDFHAVRDHYFERLTGTPVEALRQSDPARCLAISRWVTGQVMADTFAQWRSQGSVCGGGLIWFLRDLRPGTGWGLLDDRGVPKAAWHLLRRSLQPLMIALVDKGLNGLDIELVNEHAHALHASLEVAAWHGGKACIARVDRPVTLAPRSAQSVSLIAELDGFMDLGHAYRFGPPPCELLTARLRDAQGQLLAEAIHLPQGLSLERAPDIGLAATLQGDAHRGWSVVVSSQACAIGLHLEVPGYQPADDYVHLVPGEQRVIALQPEPGEPVQAPSRGVVAALNTEQRLQWNGVIP